MIRLQDTEDAYDWEEPCSDYEWCLHCERTYKRGEHRFFHGLRMCPYSGCGGDTVMDGWDWDQLRSQLPQYPAIPEPGVKYPMYPTDYPVLSIGAAKILTFLVSEIRRGRFDPANEKTLCSFKEVHDALEFQRISPQWGRSLGSHGLDLLARWTRTHKLPAITGLVVKPSKPRRPEPDYFKTYGVTEGQEEWWRAQIQAAIAFDWSPWLSSPA